MPGKKAIVIVGPTASGKSSVAMITARLSGGEIISADSMQVYKGMNIGTAKPPASELMAVRHHLVDVLDPDEPMSVSLYCKLARKAYDEISAMGRIAIIAGGTGLYVDAATGGFLFPDRKADHVLRAELYERANTEGTGALHEELAKVDPVAASRIHSNDARRIIRALEVFRTSGMPISELQKADSGVSGIPSVYYGVRMDREALVARIEARVDQMIDDGLLDELKALIASGYGGCKVALQAIGYKELIPFLDGKTGLSDAVEKIKTETRKYAKRQMSWFRRNKAIVWFDSGSMPASDIAAAIWDDYSNREVEEG